jgi:16S rRNA (cytosine967-C5)-methyltransferase
VVASRPGERVLDACAAPGGKTTMLEGDVTAVELNAGRARELRDFCARMGVAARVECADARAAEVGEGYDRVLLDAPCSDLGTLASRPDARWRKAPEQVDALAALQAELLSAALRRLRPGGTLVYSVCTISPREGRENVRRLLADEDAKADDLGAERPELRDREDPRFLQLLPHRDGTDGFFIARVLRG